MINAHDFFPHGDSRPYWYYHGIKAVGVDVTTKENIFICNDVRYFNDQIDDCCLLMLGNSMYHGNPEKTSARMDSMISAVFVISTDEVALDP